MDLVEPPEQLDSQDPVGRPEILDNRGFQVLPVLLVSQVHKVRLVLLDRRVQLDQLEHRVELVQPGRLVSQDPKVLSVRKVLRGQLGPLGQRVTLDPQAV